MRFLNFFAYFALALLLVACGGGSSNPPLTTPVPGGSVTTTLTLAKTSLDPSVSETTTVTAVLVNNGMPLAGVPVSFSVTPGYATFNPADGQVETDITGKATIVLQVAANPPADGVAELKASAVINGTPVTQTTQFYVNRASLKLANPVLQHPQIAAGESTTVSVQVLDANGNAFAPPDGVDVYFSAEKGSFIADNMVGKVRTDSDGIASVKYIAPCDVSFDTADTISATLGSSIVRSTIVVKSFITDPAAITFNYNDAKKTKKIVTIINGVKPFNVFSNSPDILVSIDDSTINVEKNIERINDGSKSKLNIAEITIFDSFCITKLIVYYYKEAN